MSTETLTDVLARHAAHRETLLGHPITTSRDVLDLLVANKDHDAFWHELDATHPDADLPQLRAALPSTPFAADLPVTDCLASMGLDAADIPVVLDDTPATDTIQEAITSAFAADSPKATAQALENLLAESPIRRAMAKMPTRSAVARGVGLVFLVCSLAGMAFGSLTACYKGVTPEA